MLGRFALTALLVGAMALAGCTTPTDDRDRGNTTGTGGNTTSPPSPPPNQTEPAVNATTPVGNATLGGSKEVQVLDNTFQPDNITVAVGATVQFTNLGQALHSATIENEDGVQTHDQDVDPGESTQVAFAQPGTYKLRCKYHSSDFDNGQVGRIAVT